MLTLNCNGQLLQLNTPKVMGIINITPNSFYANSCKQTEQEVVSTANAMLLAGASIIDVGGQSTKPGSELISAQQELQNVLPAIKAIKNCFPQAIISIDTFYSEVAQQAVKAGASIVNDISGGDMDKDMISTVASLKVPYVCTHIQGTPKTMQQNPQYTDVVGEVLSFFVHKTQACIKAGIHDFILDVGIGFGKTAAHNFELLRYLNCFKILQMPLLVGVSRKSLIYKTLGITPEQSLNGTTVLNTAALLNGANIVRVHDVAEAVEAINLLQALNANTHEQ